MIRLRPLLRSGLFSILLPAFLALNAIQPAAAAKLKFHSVVLGSVRTVPYSVEGDPSGARADETKLRVRPLVVDGKVKDWTTGEQHYVTDRTYAVRRAIRVNDALPTDHGEHWVWQRGPWLLIDRTSGKVTALHLPDYDPSVSDVVWFRDYAAYCGLTASGKQLYAVVAQLAVRRPVLSKKLGPWDVGDHPTPACAAALWQRSPLQISFSPTGGTKVSFDLVGASAVLVEDGDSGDSASSN
ncbi:MAG: hypothetical protein WA634_11670 [Silvibacterium sp.]